MKRDTKRNIQAVVDNVINDYGIAGKNNTSVLSDIVKAVTLVKDLDNEAVENTAKRKRVKFEEEKLEIEKNKIEIDAKKLELEMSKFNFEQDKTAFEQRLNEKKIEIDFQKLEFEKQKLRYETDRQRKEKIHMTVTKAIEIGLPLVVYFGLSILSLKAIYADDARIPSETWKFVSGVVRR